MEKDIYQEITNKVVAMIEQGVKPWCRPWEIEQGGIVIPLRHNGLPYSGINILVLWMVSCEKRYISPIWMTYKQAQELGGQVKKGERGERIIYANSITVTQENENGEEERNHIPYIKTYTVFNVQQIEGLPEVYYAHKVAPALDMEKVEQFINNVGASINYGGERAYYRPCADEVCLPLLEKFSSKRAYIATLAHELVHWTGHKSRLNRPLVNHFGSEDYAKEELVAELGAAFLCANLSIEPELENHASYLGSWLKALKNDKRAIFRAAAQAQKAVEYLRG